MWQRKQDDALEIDVRDELSWDPSIDASDVKISVADGVVTLSGTVPTYAMKIAAARQAEGVSGVRGVVQHLDVELPEYHQRKDAAIAEAASNVLDWDIEVPENKVKAEVNNGTVTLTGEVEWQFQREAAERAVRYLDGVTFVDDRITVKPTAKAGDVRNRIKAALERSADIDADNISVDANGSTVTLRGTVHSWNERDEARDAAWAAPGVRNVEDELTIA